MKRAFLLFAVAMLYCNSTLAQEPEPDPNLLWVSDTTWKDGFHRFLVHPNGNILAGIGSTEFELDGNTGKIIREFPYPAVFYDISPDGKYISALTDQRCVIDYETEEVIARFTKENSSPRFMPDSKTLIYDVLLKVGNDFNTKLATYNIETGGYRFSLSPLEQTSAWNINVSPDGRFVATGGKYIDNSDRDYTRLVLWDAETLEPIRVLGEFEYFNPVNSIKFSPDSKLVGFQVYWGDLYIFKTDDYSLYKHYSSDNILNGVMGFGFIANDFIAVGSDEDNQQNFEIINLNNNSTIYKRNDFTGLAEYNAFMKSLIVLRVYIHCFDFEKILSGASIAPEIPNSFTIEYLNNTLSIRNYTFETNQINCSITDINGRVLRNMNLNPSIGELRIPIKLQSGTYFFHIKDGGKEYVAKFWLVN
ncbi:MAG: T9SS type A sorting domain-containing protein [Candidatus Kapabacteria bacterium]|nr:T9SS type A sorting domain-containing protein [Candidatus Kapabacteria bacterium]